MTFVEDILYTVLHQAYLKKKLLILYIEVEPINNVLIASGEQ